jgi:hypothetical protein
MKKARWISAAIGTAVLTAGFVLPAGAAFADPGPNGNGNAGVLSLLSGNDVNAPVSAPIEVCGIALALLGGANAGCEGGAASNTVTGNSGGSGSHNGGSGSHNGGGSGSHNGGGSGSHNGGGSGSHNGNAGVISAGSGNTVNAPVSVPVSVCGVSGAVAGFANSGCKGGAASNTVIKGAKGGSHNGNAGVISALSGNNVNVPVSAPVDLCGISVALAGLSNAGCRGGSFSNTLINP